MSLRVLVLCLHSSPWSRPGVGDAGGMNVYVRHTCAELRRAGHRVRCLTLPRDGEESLPDAPDWVTTLEVPVGAVDKGDLPEHLPAMTDAALAAAGEADVVLAHYWLSAEVGQQVAARLDVPLVTIFHTTAAAKNARRGPDEPPEPEQRLAAERRLARASAAIVVNTPDEGDQLATQLGVDRARIHPIQPGIDSSVFHPPDRSTTPTRSEGPTIGLAGRLQPLKGPQVLIEAMALADVPDLHAWIIGSGDAGFVDDLRTRARQLGLTGRVDFLGNLDAPQMAERMRSADLWAVPSSSETFGLVAVEAQACRTPVLATGVDGLQHSVLDGRTGWLLPDRDPSTWARALRSATRDRAERERRGAAAAAWASSLTWSHTADALGRLLTAVGAQRVSARSHLG